MSDGILSLWDLDPNEIVRPCRKCKKIKRGRDFDKQKKRTCKDCISADQRRYRKKNRDRHNAYQREYHRKNSDRLKAARHKYTDENRDRLQEYNHKNKLRRGYNLTVADYNAMLTAQCGGCAICGTKSCPTGRKFAVDHDHTCCPGEKSCGKCVRGLLCGPCNTGLARFCDDANLLRSAIAYLEHFGSPIWNGWGEKPA